MSIESTSRTAANNSLAAAAMRRPCLHCGALCGPEDAACWFCKHPPFVRPTPPRLGQFSIRTLLSLTAIVAASLAAFRWSPLLGLLGFVWVLPAYVRTRVAIDLEKWRVPRLSGGEKWKRFAASLVIVAIAGSVAVVTVSFIFFVCMVAGLLAFGGNQSQAAAVLAGVVSIIMGIGAWGWLLWASRPRQHSSWV